MNNQFKTLEKFNTDDLFREVKTPCYVLDEAAFIKNGEILKKLQDRTGAKVLLAEKAFSNFTLFPLLSQYLAGTEASGLFEARLGREEMPEKEVHVFSAAFRDDEIVEVLKYADHIVFNSVRQLKRFGSAAKKAGKEVGLRINPECSTQEGHEIYDPCAPGSRLGVTRAVFNEEMDNETLSILDGIHFHTLCEQDSDALKKTADAVIKNWDDVLKKVRWVNMGGGHHITKDGYNIPLLEKVIATFQKKFGLQVYLEPGEAVALNAGYLVTRILDIVKNNGHKIPILDMSAACHTPDVIEMPYTPPLLGAAPVSSDEAATIALNNSSDDALSDAMNDLFGGALGEVLSEAITEPRRHVYRLAGPSCLAGDVIGDYALERELNIGDILIFGDMAIYSICKNNTFNGMPLPGIYLLDKEGKIELIKKFGYEDFKNRLG
ncbi:MAG: carboxynorspermidine decarboxylase [Lachnospiraceae bacterium]|nr:carboxynorspermidine decarboxylase [Lachnospiraceae bacterium]